MHVPRVRGAHAGNGRRGVDPSSVITGVRSARTTGGPDAAMPVPDTTEPMIVKSLRIPLRLVEALDHEAAARGIGVTVLMRELLEAALHDPARQRYVPLEEAITVLSRLARTIPPAA